MDRPLLKVSIFVNRLKFTCWTLLNNIFYFSAESTRVVDELSGSVSVLDRWPDLVALLAGSKRFDSNFFDFCLKSVFVQFEKIGADPGLFRQFLSEYNSKMDVKRQEIQVIIRMFVILVTSSFRLKFLRCYPRLRLNVFKPVLAKSPSVIDGPKSQVRRSRHLIWLKHLKFSQVLAKQQRVGACSQRRLCRWASLCWMGWLTVFWRMHNR